MATPAIVRSHCIAGCLLLGWLGAGTGLPAQQDNVGIGQAPVPTLSVNAREVLLDVVATDAAGHPIPGLTAADFKVTEEGAPQPIRRVTEHEPMSAADVARIASMPALPPNTFTNYTPAVDANDATVILLDAMDTPVPVQMRLRQQVIGYLKHMQPGASIAIFQLDTEMHLIQGFTSDPKVLLAAAESQRNMPSMARPMRSNPEMNQLMRMQILRDGMQTVGRYLAGYPGRKSLIWFSAQVPSSLFYGSLGTPFRDTFSLLEEGGNDRAELTGALTVSQVAVYPVDTRGVQGFGAFDAEHGRAPSAGYSNSFADSQSLNHASLDAAAAQTGGKAYYNTNDMGKVIAEVVRDGSDYYTVAYATTNEKWNGQFQRVKVAIDRPGAKLQYRPGYYATEAEADSPADGAVPDQPAAEAGSIETGVLIPHSSGGFAAAMQLGAIPPTEILFSARLAAADATGRIEKSAAPPPGNFLRPQWRGQPFRTYSIAFDANARQMRLTRGPNGRWQGRVQFVAVVYDPTGAEVNALNRTAVLDLDEPAYRLALQQGLQVSEQIAVPAKGNFFLRLGVHDLVADRMGALECAVDQVKLDKP